MKTPTITDLKKQARAMARASDLTYCQALDALARQYGARHWKDLAQREQPLTENPDIGPATADEIGRALRAGALQAVLADTEMEYEQRFNMALAVIKGQPGGDDFRPVHYNTASHIVSLLAHKALIDGDRRLEPKLWQGRPVCAEMIRDTVLSIQSEHMSDGKHDAIWLAATWSWFNDISSIGLELGYEKASMMLAAATALSADDQRKILDLSASLAEPEAVSQLAQSEISPRQREEVRVAFKKMIVECYMLRTGQHGSDFFELAEVNLQTYLADNAINFGDPSRAWNRDLANEIANADMEVWPQFI